MSAEIARIIDLINKSDVKITLPQSPDDWNRKVGDDIVIMMLGNEENFALMIGSLPYDKVKELVGHTVTLTQGDTVFTSVLSLGHKNSYPSVQFSGLKKGEYLLKIS